MDLTEDEVREILDLIEKSDFDFLELELGELRLTVSKGPYVPRETAATAVSPSPPLASVEPIEPPAREQIGPAPEAPVAKDGLEPVSAPMVGTFYAAPKPGAPPFVEQGSTVTPEMTVGLIEVMKVFTGISARVDGVIEEVLVSDSEFVEFGQVLFLVRSNGNGSDKAATQ